MIVLYARIMIHRKLKASNLIKQMSLNNFVYPLLTNHIKVGGLIIHGIFQKEHDASKM